MKDFTNEEDVKTSKETTKDTGRMIKVDEGKTPIYLLGSHYFDGFAHWVKFPNGDTVRVVCGGGEDGGGYAPDVCPICQINKERWAKARDLDKAGQSSKSKKLKQDTNRQRGSYEMLLLAAKGEMQVVSIKGGKRRLKVDFDTPQIGILRLTKTQRDNLWSLPGSGQFEFMDSKKDLLNRYIVFDKAKRDDQDYATIQFLPASKPTPKPKYKLSAEEKEALNVGDEFDVDEEELERVASVLLGNAVEPSEVDYEDEEEGEDGIDLEIGEGESEEEEEEAESEEEEEFEWDGKDGVEGLSDDDDALVDDDTDDDDLVLATDDDEEEDSNFDEGFLDDVDDSFEDDLPWDDEEDKPAIPKKAPKKKASAKKPPTAKKTTTPKKAGVGSKSNGRSVGSGKKQKSNGMGGNATKTNSTKKPGKKSTKKGAPKQADL